jgi:hypothetical protein
VDGNSKQVLSIPGSDVRQPSWGPFMDWAQLNPTIFLIYPFLGWITHFDGAWGHNIAYKLSYLLSCLDSL